MPIDPSWIATAQGLFALAATGAALFIRSEIRGQIQELRIDIERRFAELPTALNGTYRRSELCLVQMEAVKQQMEAVKHELERIARGIEE